MIKSTPPIALLQLLLAQMAISVNIVLAKYLVPFFPVSFLLELRFLLGALMLWVLIKINKQQIYHNKLGQALNVKDWWIFFLQALCGGYLFNILLLHGLHHTNAIMAGIICSTIPAVIALFSFFLLRETLSVGKILSIIIAVVGLMIISSSKGSISGVDKYFLWGSFLILLSVIPEALFTILAKWHGSHVTAYVMAFIINAFNALLFLPSAIFAINATHFVMPTLFQWVLIMAYALSGGVVFFVLWYRGLEHCSTSTAALMTATMPVGTTVLAWIFLREAIHLPMLLGMLCVMLSIVFGAA